MRILFGYGTEGGKAASNYRRNWDLAFGNAPQIDEDGTGVTPLPPGFNVYGLWWRKRAFVLPRRIVTELEFDGLHGS